MPRRERTRRAEEEPVIEVRFEKTVPEARDVFARRLLGARVVAMAQEKGK